MKRWKEMQDVTDEEFLRQVGVPRAHFATILEKVQAYLETERTRNRMKNRGVKTTELPVEDRVLLTFYYLRHHPTFQNLGDVFGISQGYANKRYHEYLDILVKVLRLPGRKALRDGTWLAVLIDVTSPLNVPGRSKGGGFPGRKSGIPPKCN